jgi:predicted transglutaminase-like cysteine proteinase
MRIRNLTAVGIVLGLLLAGSNTAMADFVGDSQSRISVSGSQTAPVGFQVFCLQNPSYCRGGGGSEVELSDAVWRAIGNVNTAINRAIRPHGEPRDTWSIGVREGDCEDYVLAKRAELIKAGLPAGALRIATANTRQGVGHAVLVVRTSQGDYVLDNLTNEVKSWDKTGLRWVAMSGSNPMRWQSIR